MVSAINAKQVKVVFNKEVDKTSAERISNYTISGITLSNATDAPNDYSVAKLQSDGKSVLISIDVRSAGSDTAIGNQSKFNVTVKNVKDKEGKYISETTVKDVQLVDTTAPVVTDVVVDGPKSFKIFFSEPVNPASANLLIDEGKVSGAITGITEESALQVVTSAELAEGAHKVVINNSANNAFADYVGIPVVRTTKEFTVVKETGAPTVTVKKAEPDKITLSFSKPVKDLNSSNNEVKVGYTKVATSSIQAKSGITYDGETYAAEWEITPPSILTGSNVTITIDSKASAKSDQILDKWGNKLATTTLTADVVADTTKPAATGVEVKSNKKIVITFNKSVVKEDAENRTNYTLYDKDGKIFKDKAGITDSYGHPVGATQFNYNNDKKEVTIEFSTALAAENYSIKVEDIEDRVSYNPQTIDDTTLGFSIADVSMLQLSSASWTGGSDRKITLTFSKSVATSGDGSALELRNYKLGGEALPSGSSIELGGSDKVVIITLGGSDNPTNLIIAASVKDNAGSLIDVTSASRTVLGATVSVADIQKIRLVSHNTVTFELKQPVKSIDVSGIKVADGVDVKSATFENKNILVGGSYVFGSVVTLKTDAKALETKVQASGNLLKAGATTNATYEIDFPANAIEVVSGAKISASNVAHNAANSVVADKAAPYIKSITTRDLVDSDGNAGSDGMIDQLVVRYTEAISNADVNKNAFDVKDYTVKNAFVSADGTNIATTGEYVIINVEQSGKQDTNKKPAVKQVVAISDINDNVRDAEDSASVSTTDGAAPVVVSVKVETVTGANNDKVTIKFNEKLNSARATAATVLSNDITVTTGGSSRTINSSTASLSEDGTELSFVLTEDDDAVYTNDTFTVAYTNPNDDATELTDAAATTNEVVDFSVSGYVTGAVADAKAPIVVSADFTDATTLVIVFSEKVTAVASDFTPGAVTNGGAGTAASFTISAISGSGTNTITLTVAGDAPLVTGDTAVMAIGAGVTDGTNVITAVPAQAVGAF